MNDAAPVTQLHAAPAEPTPAQVAAAERKRLKREREERKAARAAKMRATRAAAKAKRTAPAPASPGATETPDGEAGGPTDTDLQRDAAAFLGVLYRCIGLVVGLLGFEWAPVTRAACHEDAAALVPLMRRVGALASVVRSVAAPFVLVERIASSVRRKAAPSSPPPAQPEGPR